jgi:PIN domain nuclease of toxin-antitoxin system
VARPIVVDSSALLAVLLDEPGGRAVENRLPGSAMSVVNLAEVLSQLAQRGLDPERLTELVRRLDLEVVPADLSQAVGAARLHAATRAQGLALADCFCLGLGLARKAEVLTADRAWLAVRVGVPVTLVR